MSALLLRAGLRHSLRHPWQFGLSLLGIALGVAVLVAVQLASDSARRAFDLSLETVTGRATHQLRAAAGDLDEALYMRLRTAGTGIPMAPVVQGRVRAEGRPGAALTLLGLDPFAEAPFRGYAGARSEGGGQWLSDLLTRPGAVLASPGTAAALGASPGDAIVLEAGGRRVSAQLVGLLSPGEGVVRGALHDLLVADIATAQELLGRLGRLSRVDLVLPAGTAVDGDGSALQGLLPPGVVVESADTRSVAAGEMTRAFNLNLTMLSLLALVVGTYLIYNTVTFSVVQRRESLGTLRALGVTRREVMVLVLGEAALTGLAGGLAGAALGLGLAQVLVGLVAATINDLYYAVNVRELSAPGWLLAAGVGLGVVASVLAAVVPALEAARVAPRAALARSHLEATAHRMLPRAALVGAAALLAGALLLLLPDGGLGAGFGALFALIVGFTAFAPLATVAVTRLLRPLATAFGGRLAGMAVSGIEAHLSRTAVAVAALMVALSVTVGVGIMIDSFRGSVESWLRGALQADLYVVADGARPLPDDVAGRVAAVPGVRGVSRRYSTLVHGEHGSTRVIALDLYPEGRRGLRLLDRAPEPAWQSFDAQGAVFVSESFAYRHGVGAGARLRLTTEAGPRDFPVAATFRNYASERGLVMMAGATFREHWRQPGFGGLGVYLAPGAAPAAVRAGLAEVLPARDDIHVRSNREIRDGSLEVFDRTFTITRVLRMLAALVAFVGVLSALMALQLERMREMAVLRACGLTRMQVWSLVETQTGVLGVVAGVLSLPLGLALAGVLTLVINRRSFGWSLDLAVDPVLLVQAVALGAAAALAAGVYPALRMAGTPPALALRED